MLIGKFEAANFFQLSLRNYSIFPSFGGGGGPKNSHKSKVQKERQQIVFSYWRDSTRLSTRLGSTFIIAFLLRINFACLICQFFSRGKGAGAGVRGRGVGVGVLPRPPFLCCFFPHAVFRGRQGPDL